MVIQNKQMHLGEKTIQKLYFIMDFKTQGVSSCPKSMQKIKLSKMGNLQIGNRLSKMSIAILNNVINALCDIKGHGTWCPFDPSSQAISMAVASYPTTFCMRGKMRQLAQKFLSSILPMKMFFKKKICCFYGKMNLNLRKRKD